MEKMFSDINGNFHAPEQQWIWLDLWTTEMEIPTPMNIRVDQINAFSSQELLHLEATVQTVHVILDISPYFPRIS